MKKEQIQELFEQFESICYDYKGVDCWSAREIQQLSGYSKWDNFIKVIEKVKVAAEGVEIGVSDHFAEIREMVLLGSSSQREIPDCVLTRYACYKVMTKP